MSRRAADRSLLTALWSAAIVSMVVLGAIVSFVVLEAVPVLREIGLARIVTDPSWHPLSGNFGLAPMVAATVVVSLLSVALAAPFGIALGAFEQFYLAPKKSRLLRRTIEILSGIPSVVVGLWGLVVIVPLLSALKPPGTSLLAATLVLALMLIPTIAFFSSIAFERVEPDLRSASTALSLSRRVLVLEIAMPLAARGISAGIVMALARAIGETMMVLMVAGNVPGWPTDLLEPVRTLTANMALEMAYADGLHRSALFLSGVLVLVVALVLATIAGALSSERNAAN